MGYYSDVLIMLSDDMDKKLRTELQSEDKELQEEVLDLLDKYVSYSSINPETKNHLYFWDNIKWYIGYDWVKDSFRAENWIDNHIQLNDNIYEYRYIIVGEDPSDIQEFGRLYDPKFEPYPEAHIHFNKE